MIWLTRLFNELLGPGLRFAMTIIAIAFLLWAVTTCYEVL
jgi:hypothetical protein